MIDVKDLVNKSISHKAVIDQSHRDIRDNLIRIEDEQRKLNNLINENKLTELSYDYLDKLIKEESGKFIKSINDMLNYAVKTIFFDRDYNIEIRTDDNKTTIRLKYTNDEGNLVDADVKDCGGGIRTVISTLLNVYFIFKYNVEPIYFVDEGFSALSSQYVDVFFNLLSELSEKNNLKILLITHDNRFISLDTVKNVYEVVDGKVIKVLNYKKV